MRQSPTTTPPFSFDQLSGPAIETIQTATPLCAGTEAPVKDPPTKTPAPNPAPPKERPAPQIPSPAPAPDTSPDRDLPCPGPCKF